MSLSRIIFCLFGVIALLSGSSTALAARAHHQRVTKVAASQQAAAPVNINTADAAALAKLNGIGPKKAAAIVAYRSKHGRFQSLEDLTAIKGIGSKFLVRLQKRNPGKMLVK